jgi:hypothetical protein
MRFLLLVGVLGAGCDFGPVDAVVDAARDDGAPDADPDAARDAPPDAPPDVPDPLALTLSPPAVEHGLIRVGDIMGTTIVVRNPNATGSIPLDGIAIAGTGFTMSSTTCGATLPPATECTIAVEITPQALTAYAATLTVTSSGIAHEVPFSATGAWELTVAKDGIGNGTITSVPAGITCSLDCSGLFPGDVELEVTPDPGATVRLWSIPGCSGLQCSVTAALEGRNVTAWFALGRMIEVTRQGNGTITSSPAGINCGSTCSHPFPTGPVTLTATPFVGQTFEGWSVLACGTNPTCVIPAGGDVAITAGFSTTQTTNFDVVIAGDADGEVLVYHEGGLVGQCTSSCSLAVPAGELVVAASTPYSLESLTGTGCVADGDRCTITPTGPTQITATFRRDAKDLWTFFGNPGEEFSKGAFDAAGNLIAGSQQRVIKLGPTGALVWERPPTNSEILVAASGVIYLGDSRGTVKLGLAGDELWIRPGWPRALDTAGNVLVVESSGMTLYQPDGAAIWTAPGQGTEIDGTGTIYQPFTQLEENDPPGHYHRNLYAHRYGATGVPLADTGMWGSVEEWGEYQVAVTPNRIAVLSRDEWDYKIVGVGVFNPTTGEHHHYVDAWRMDGFDELPRGFVTGAGDDIGFVHDPDELAVWNFLVYGYQLDRLRADDTRWTVMRFPPSSEERQTYYGTYFAGAAGGPSGQLAVLGHYRPFYLDTRSRPDVGIIQAFAP